MEIVKQHYDFFGDLQVTVAGGESRTATQYRKMYDHFRVPSHDGEPDMVIAETNNDVDLDVVLGEPKYYFGRSDGAFVAGNSRNFMKVSPGWDYIEVSHSREPFHTIYPMEFKIRRRMVERDKALLHASGARIDGETTLFPAWRGAGKTNTLLSLLREGADFLSDDRLWVGADGSALGYPLGVNLQPYNIDSFSELQVTHDTLQDQIRHDVHEFIDERFDRSGPLPETAIAYLNDSYLDGGQRDFVDVRSLYPDSEYVAESSVDNVVFLQAAPDARTISIEQVSTTEAMSMITTICNYEWDGQLREYFHAYDALVGDGDMVESLDRVIDRERAVFRELFEDVELYRASIPRERDWSAHGLDTAIAEAMT